MTTDLDELAAWRGGDAAAGQRLMAKHYEQVVRFFEIKVGPAAEDLTQQTFLACVEGKERLEVRVTFRAYLFGIARRMLLGHLRQAERLERMARFQAASSPATVTTASRLVSRRQEQRMLLRALDRLSVDAQIAIQLHYWDGLRPQEIAEVQGVNASTVSSRLMRARDSLRETLRKASRNPETLASLLGDLEGWTRSLAGEEPPTS